MTGKESESEELLFQGVFLCAVSLIGPEQDRIFESNRVGPTFVTRLPNDRLLVNRE